MKRLILRQPEAAVFHREGRVELDRPVRLPHGYEEWDAVFTSQETDECPARLRAALAASEAARVRGEGERDAARGYLAAALQSHGFAFAPDGTAWDNEPLWELVRCMEAALTGTRLHAEGIGDDNAALRARVAELEAWAGEVSEALDGGAGPRAEIPRLIGWMGQRYASAVDDLTAARARVAEAENEVPRHLRIAMANAQRALKNNDVRALATINEDVQGLVDAALGYATRRAEKAEATLWAIHGACADHPWSLLDVLTKLADAADHLLHGHHCDQHGHEQVHAAAAAARVHVESVRTVLTAAFAGDLLLERYRTGAHLPSAPEEG